MGAATGLRPRAGPAVPASLELAGVLAGLLALGTVLVSRTWMTWIQPTIDSGRELSIPARVAAGERLYGDVVAHYGPVPAWLHAAAYRVAGFHLWTPLLLLVPLAALASLSLLVLGRRAGEARGAAWGVAWGLSIALAAPNGGALVFPYSFAAAHALAWSSAALALALSSSRFAPASSLLWGLALASKPEAALASLAAALLAAAVSPPALRRRLLSFAAGGVGIGAAIWGVALRGLPLGPLRLEGPLVLFSPPAEWRRVYATVSGLSGAASSLSDAVTSAFLAALLLGVVLLAERVRPRLGGALPFALWALSLLSAGLLGTTGAGRLVDRATPPLLFCAPAALLAASLGLAWSALRQGSTAALPDPSPTSREAEGAPPASSPAVALVSLVAFGGLSSLRVLLGMRYGWSATPYAALAALPLSAAAGVLVFRLVRRLLPAGGGARTLAPILAALVLLQSARIWIAADPARFEAVETPRGTLRLPRPLAAPVRGALGYVGARARPGDELAGFPEAGFFSFALALPNALRQDQVLPGHLDAAAEAAACERIRERRPRFVLLANQPSAAFGPVSFGSDYATGLWAEVERLYRPAAFFGSGPPGDPVGFGPFFVRVYELREAPRVTPTG